MASIYWLLGNGRANVTTYATQLPHSHDPTTDTYTVTSTLTYSVNRSYNGQNLICVASNEATSEPGGSAETSETLNVKYAPDITVNSPPYTQNDAIRTVTCHPSGNPDSYTYHKWQHKSRYGDLIRELDGNKTLKIPNVPVLLRYQDSGKYVCTASNGIRDNDNMFEQIGSGYVIVNAQPVFTSDTIDKAKQFGEISKAVDIYVNVYSVPKFAIYIWTRDGKPITTQNLAKYASSSSPTIVYDKVHGKEVHLDGYKVTLTIRDLTAQDFNNYSLTLKSGFADVTHTIVLESTSVPETPGNFSMTTTSTTSITMQWDPKSGGGHKQAFYIQYRVQGAFEWYTTLAGEEDINEPKRRRIYEVINLQKGKAYGLRIYAENRAGKRSNVTEVFIAVTETSETSTTRSAVIGGVVGAVVTLGIVCASVMVIVLLKRRKGQNKTEKNNKSYENTGFQERQKDDEYEEVRNKCDVQQKQSSKTYETLGTKDTLNVYDGLDTSKGLTPSKSSLGHYEALGVQDKPNIYSELENQKEEIQLKEQPAEKNILKASNNHKEGRKLNTTQGPKENVYANEVF
ncbi:neural cell adhesion molecule 1-like isoform X2 [Mytilus californianus]|uniref:neural cell adhesion molecule 1-like isoform X2 n=1 Tax=Mytilus californianus TaxID=6549 RepID=UPI002245AA4E|nr:neural cell adhesion molecule 1-like isoform X2 [Mytilus californianus]